MSRLQKGDNDAWDLFVRRYKDAIIASVGSLVGASRRADVEDFASEFLAWLYLPKETSEDGQIAERLRGLQLMDDSGRRVHRFRGWLYETLRRWLASRARNEARRVNLRAARVASEMSSTMRRPADSMRRIDEALVCLAADDALESLRQDSYMHYRALLDLLHDADLNATAHWLLAENMPASPATTSRIRTRASRLFRERLLKLHQDRFGGDESDVLPHLPALAVHLASTAAILLPDA